jgi:hypothetical protein
MAKDDSMGHDTQIKHTGTSTFMICVEIVSVIHCSGIARWMVNGAKS